MRIGYLSSFPPIECGIATYTSHLEAACQGQAMETFVVAPHGASGERVLPTYRHGTDDFAPAVLQMFTQLTPDIVHIQHDYSLFGASRGMEVVDLVLRLRLIEVPVVITLHTVYETLEPGERLVLKHLLPECAAIIVHEEYQRDTLADEFGPELAAKVHVIDHGIREVKPVHGAKRKLDLHSNKVVLLAGYLRPTKGFHKALDFFAEVEAANPDAVLILAAKTRNIEYADYRQDLLDSLAEASFSQKVQILNGQFPQHTLDTLFSAADVVVLPYDRGTQSGVLSQAIAFQRPIVTSDLRAFQSVTRRSGTGISCSDDRIGAEINRILASRKVAAGFASAADTYIRRRAGWSVIARRHRDLYREVREAADRPGRYVYVPGTTEPSAIARMDRGAGTHKPHTLAIAEWLKTAKSFDEPKARTTSPLEFVD